MAMAPNNRGKPFTNWVKRLNQKMKRTKGLNNPYPQSGHVSSKHAQRKHESQPQSIDYPHSNNPDVDDGQRSNLPEPSLVIHSAEELSNRQSMISASSDRASADVDTEGCVRTTAGTAASYGGTSLAGTMITATDPRRPNSTFSSPAPSARSVATTLSTIQTQMVHGGLPGAATNGTNTNTNNSSAQASSSRANHQTDSVQYSQPQALVAAVDRTTRTAYRPATYSAIIANNLLSDNISILTLASSTQRRRRRSWDTDFDHASVRALPPSQFGGSRESLPLSVLSANLDGQPTSPGLNTARSIAERSVSGMATGHGRSDSLSGSIGGGPVPVASES